MTTSATPRQKSISATRFRFISVPAWDTVACPQPTEQSASEFRIDEILRGDKEDQSSLRTGAQECALIACVCADARGASRAGCHRRGDAGPGRRSGSQTLERQPAERSALVSLCLPASS